MYQKQLIGLLYKLALPLPRILPPRHTLPLSCLTTNYLDNQYDRRKTGHWETLVLTNLCDAKLPKGFVPLNPQIESA